MSLLRPIVIVLVLFGLVACTIPVEGGRGVVTGTLTPSGSSVFVNGVRVGARTRIDPGDRVSTGARSSALLEWSDGTSLQLDENSDPIIQWDGQVLAINVGYGWFLIDTGEMEVRVVNELADVVAHSRLVVYVEPASRFDAFLLDGRMSLLRPPGQGLLGGQKLSVGRTGGVRYGTISASEGEGLERRFSRWRFADASGTRIPTGTIIFGPRVFGPVFRPRRPSSGGDGSGDGDYGDDVYIE